MADELEDLLEWISGEIEVEETGYTRDTDELRKNARKAGFNQGLRHVRDEVIDRIEK